MRVMLKLRLDKNLLIAIVCLVILFHSFFKFLNINHMVFSSSWVREQLLRGIVSSFIFFNEFYKTYPFIFWSIGITFSLISIYRSFSSRRKEAKESKDSDQDPRTILLGPFLRHILSLKAYY